MDQAQIEQDLQLIKRTIKASVRYTNIPPLGYLCSGIFGLAGPALTYLIIGADKAGHPDLLTRTDLLALAGVWIGIMLAALCSSAFFMARRARKRKQAAWNSLSARIFLSQLPVLLVAAILTSALAGYGLVAMVPALWLLFWGLILFSFFFFTGTEHLLQSIIFIALGTAGLLVPFPVTLLLLAAGFGLINLVWGIAGLVRGDAGK